MVSDLLGSDPNFFQTNSLSNTKSSHSELHCFGGSLLKNSHAKTARPLNSKKAVHIVLKTSLPKHQTSLVGRERLLRNLALKQGRSHNVKVFRMTLNSEGMHLILRFRKRRNFQNFLRSLCGLIARKTLKAERGRPKAAQGSSPKFWAQRPFSRIVNWGPHFKKLETLLKSPKLPSFGFLPLRQQQFLGILEIRKRVLSMLWGGLSTL